MLAARARRGALRALRRALLSALSRACWSRLTGARRYVYNKRAKHCKKRGLQRFVQLQLHSSAMIFFTVAAGNRPSARWGRKERGGVS